MSAAVASIRARFGQRAIGLGCLGIRYVRVRLEPTLLSDDAGESGSDESRIFIPRQEQVSSLRSRVF